MLLQIALDKPEHFALLPHIRNMADIVEVGTPLLKRFGIGAIATARELCPDTLVLADTKTVDGGKLEAEMVFGAGAAFMTVLSSTSRATHDAVGRVAAEYGATVIIDTIAESGKKDLLPANAFFPTVSPTSAFICRPTRVTRAIDRPRTSTPSTECIGAALRCACRRNRPRHHRRGSRRRAGDPHRRQRHNRVGASQGDGKVDTGQTQQSRPWMAIGTEIADLLERIDAQSFSRVVRAFDDEARRWFFSGQGRSGLAAQMAAMQFMHMGRQGAFCRQVDGASIRAGDGLVLVSGSGETSVSVNFARIAKGEGAEVVLLTHKPDSTLARIADVVLVAPARNPAIRRQPVRAGEPHHARRHCP